MQQHTAYRSQFAEIASTKGHLATGTEPATTGSMGSPQTARVLEQQK